MPTSSSGVGDDLGSTPYSSIREQETTAFVQVNRDRLGIVQDSLEVIFTQFGGNLWKYESSADRPILAPLLSIRTSQSRDSDRGDIWKAWFDNLLEQIPPDTKAKYLRDLQLPPENRNPAYAALGNTLTGIARLLAWVDTTHPELFVPAPKIDQQSFVTNGQNILSAMKNYLVEIGPNDPDYDRLSHVIGEAESAFLGMQKINEETPKD